MGVCNYSSILHLPGKVHVIHMVALPAKVLVDSTVSVTRISFRGSEEQPTCCFHGHHPVLEAKICAHGECRRYRKVF
ncbi:hypothetical protein IFM89_023611 [Coptis chinensis]|uniref:Uncharacterized protein n=1 Tax=Coptis chinensis TaxID=261450 RepID=A0A835HLK3_9MAGN|nr:hypothetical protein IFM89_023611 [Coptis chinensis]